MASENIKNKSKLTVTPMKTTGQTTRQRQPLPSDKNLEVSEPAILPELRLTNLEERVKKQNELIEKFTKKVKTLEGHVI